MRYWLTTHWPLRQGDSPAVSSGVWLPEGREAAGAKLAPGDMVLVYESKSGRTEVRQLPDGLLKKIPCQTGREGIVFYGRVAADLTTIPGSQPEQYTDGSSIWWRWYAPLTILSQSGFVPRNEVNIALDYKPSYNFRGFGALHSGLRELSDIEFQDIFTKYHAWNPLTLPSCQVPHGGGTTGGGGESDTHLFLKEYVAANPATAIGEQGLKTLGVEYPFPPGDRADIVLTDIHNRVVAVEIEPSVGSSEDIGPLQAIKYRYMLEWVTKRAPGDSRAILIAHSIHKSIRKVCDIYGVECVEVDKREVAKWRKSQNL